jgi:hypothetical protein
MYSDLDFSFAECVDGFCMTYRNLLHNAIVHVVAPFPPQSLLPIAFAICVRQRCLLSARCDFVISVQITGPTRFEVWGGL